MISKQVIWRECTEEEKNERVNRDPTLARTIMMTGENKSRPGKRIRDNDENNFVTISST